MNSEPHNRLAFSLIELLAVIVIMGVLASTVSVAASGLLANQSIQSDLERFRTLDASARSLAKSGEPGKLLFDLRKNSVVYRPEDNSHLENEFQLDREFRSDLDSIVTPGYSRSVSNGIAFNDIGISPTYAVLFKHHRKQVALMFAGGTGYSEILKDVHDVPRLP